MKCPRDGTHLARVIIDGVELDKCHKCDGIWCDRDEMEQLRDRKISEVLDQDRSRVEMIEWNIEEPLDLRRMQIHSQHTIGSCRRDQVSDQLRRDRDPRLVLPVLPRISEVRQNRGNPLGTRAPSRIHHDEELEQIVGRRERRLDDENIAAANVLVDSYGDLAIAEAIDIGLPRLHTEIRGDLFRQSRIGVTREDA